MDESLDLNCMLGLEGLDLPCKECRPECPAFSKHPVELHTDSLAEEDEDPGLTAYLLFIR